MSGRGMPTPAQRERDRAEAAAYRESLFGDKALRRRRRADAVFGVIIGALWVSALVVASPSLRAWLGLGW